MDPVLLRLSEVEGDVRVARWCIVRLRVDYLLQTTHSKPFVNRRFRQSSLASARALFSCQQAQRTQQESEV